MTPTPSICAQGFQYRPAQTLFNTCILWRGVVRWGMVIFNCIKYLKTKRGYYRTRRPVPGVEQLLHRAVWVEHNGPIPDGHDVHHGPLGLEHNEIENLELLSHAAHATLHAMERLTTLPEREITCQGCKKVFKTKTRKKWCGWLCRKRAQASRLYKELRADPKRWAEHLKQLREQPRTEARRQIDKKRYEKNKEQIRLKYVEARTSVRPYKPHRSRFMNTRKE